jgi:hypothetical protein
MQTRSRPCIHASAYLPWRPALAPSKSNSSKRSHPNFLRTAHPWVARADVRRFDHTPGRVAVIEDALAFWLGAPAPKAYRRHPARRSRDAGRLVDAVIDAANRL